MVDAVTIATSSVWRWMRQPGNNRRKRRVRAGKLVEAQRSGARTSMRGSVPQNAFRSASSLIRHTAAPCTIYFLATIIYALLVIFILHLYHTLKRPKPTNERNKVGGVTYENALFNRQINVSLRSTSHESESCSSGILVLLALYQMLLQTGEQTVRIII
jgi:hypothetical protein